MAFAEFWEHQSGEKMFSGWMEVHEVLEIVEKRVGMLFAEFQVRKREMQFLHQKMDEKWNL